MRILHVSAPEHHAVIEDSELSRVDWDEIKRLIRDGELWDDELPECDFEPEDEDLFFADGEVA